MIKLNRITEYGLIALKSISESQHVVSAREVADLHSIPYEVTAKTLQKMKDFGFIESAQGVHGGYLLKRELSSITLSEFLDCLEGPQLLVACTGDKNIHSTECAYEHACDVRPMMTRLNHRVRDFLMTIKLTELTQ